MNNKLEEHKQRFLAAAICIYKKNSNKIFFWEFSK